MFLAQTATDSDPGDRGPLSDFWYGPTPGKGSAGVRVTDETAMRLATLYACVNLIAQDLAKVPLQLFRRRDDGGRERVTDHPVVKLLRQPTSYLTGLEWKQRLQANLLLRGNSYCEIRTNGRGKIRELKPWKPDLVRVEVMPSESLRYHVRDEQRGTEDVYVEGEVLHMRGLAMNGPLGLSPIDQMRDAIGEGIAAQSYAATFFANDARPGVWVEHPGHFKDEAIRTEWIARFKRMFGGAGRFNPLVAEYGIKVHQLDPVDHAALQFIELRKLKGNEICSIYRVPPHKVGILERSTNNNIEHQGIEYVTDCLLSWCRRWEERLGQDLLNEDERDQLYFEFNLDALMRGDMKTRFEAYTSATGGAPWMVRNEVRAKENMEPIKGGDELIDPLNMQNPGGNPKKPPRPQPTQRDPEDDPTDASGRAATLELQARRRVLNRETRALSKEWDRCGGDLAAFQEVVSSFYAFHLPFVAQALVVDRDRAEAYCLAQCAEIERAIDAKAMPLLLAAWEADSHSMQFSPLPPAQPKKES
jgi:HK97 family phage portal protein